MELSKEAFAEKIMQTNERFLKAKEEVGKVIVGQKKLIDSLFIALLADGNILLEGLPGLAKTLLANSFAKVLNLDFKRVQFTPDLLPADLIGTSVYNPKDGSFRINQGPIFTQVLLADEINRAPAKVQSALLEVMQEKQITISGQTFKVQNPYLVIATQNPIEQEGTYPLPEAQTDRFMFKLKVNYPDISEEKEILTRMGTLQKKPEAAPVLNAEEILEARSLVNLVYIDEKVIDYILKLVNASRNPKQYSLDIGPWIQYGASPRASLSLKIASKARAFLQGRDFVTPQDVKAIAFDVLRHRLKCSYEAEAEDVTSENIIETLLEKIPSP